MSYFTIIHYFTNMFKYCCKLNTFFFLIIPRESICRIRRAFRIWKYLTLLLNCTPKCFWEFINGVFMQSHLSLTGKLPYLFSSFKSLWSTTTRILEGSIFREKSPLREIRISAISLLYWTNNKGEYWSMRYTKWNVTKWRRSIFYYSSVVDLAYSKRTNQIDYCLHHMTLFCATILYTPIFVEFRTIKKYKLTNKKWITIY